MIRPGNEMRVHLCRDVVDFRKQIRGLSVLVEEELELDPFSSADRTNRPHFATTDKYQYVN